MKRQIPIFFSTDDVYAPYLAVALHSLIQNASPEFEYRIVILYQNLSERNREKLNRLQKPGFRIEYADMAQKLKGVSDKLSNKLRCDYFTMTIYFRLFIPAMFPEFDKGIYLDSDVVVPGDISQLYEVDLQGNLIGACIDHSIQNVPPLTKYVDEAVGVDHTRYINSGVLLMDMQTLRRVRFEERFLELMNAWHFDSIAPDQDYINAMCFGKIHFLDPVWDVMPDENHADQGTPRLIHYNLFSKPWCYDNIQYGDEFWRYARDSGYYDELVEEKRNYTQARKDADAQCMRNMVARGLEIIEKGIPFSSAFCTGKEKRL
ncbi:MAG: glycosyltransferase family 8 protein [Faecousia sp.]